MDSDTVERLLARAGAGELLGAGANGATPDALEALKHGVVAYITRVAATAKRRSEGSNRDGGNIRDVSAALEPLAHLSRFLREKRPSPAGDSLEPEVADVPAGTAPFVSVFATPMKQPSYADPKIFGALPAAHHCRTATFTKEKPGDYVEMRKAKGAEFVAMQTAMVNLGIRVRGGIALEGFPHLQILKHTTSPPYLNK